MAIQINLKQAKKLVECFGGEDSIMTVIEGDENYHSGPGLYGYFTDYPEEGCIFLDDLPKDDIVEWRDMFKILNSESSHDSYRQIAACDLYHKESEAKDGKDRL